MIKLGYGKEKLRDLDWVAVGENYNLGVTASTVTILTTKYDLITLMNITYVNADSAIEWTEFGAATTLTNGIKIMIDGIQFGKTIKTVGDLATLGRVFISPSDLDAATVSYVIQVEIDFNRIASGGIQVGKHAGDRTIEIIMGDDISAWTGLISANVFGWTLI